MLIIPMTLCMLGYFLFSLISLRQRRLRGKLIKEFEQQASTRWINSKPFLYGLMILAISAQSFLLWERADKLALSDFSMLVFWLGWFPYMIAINTTPGVYEHGIWDQGFLLRWDRIESYKWYRGGFYQFTALRFKKASSSLFEPRGLQFPD